MAAPSRRSWLLLPTTILILVASTTHLSLIMAANDEQKLPITLPGCPDKCGEVSIPYPFGTKAGCFLPGFDVTCNTSFNPPRAFLNATTNQHYVGERYYSEASPSPTGALSGDSRSVWPLELLQVLPGTSELRVYGAIRSDCLSDNSSSRNHTVKLQGTTLDAKADGEGPFSLSPLRNALVGVGLAVQPKMVRSMSIDTTTGYMQACLSYIADGRLAESGSCTGQGCCQSSFKVRPEASLFSYSYFSVAFQKQDTTYATGPRPPCTYAMVVETSWYNFSTDDMYGYEALHAKYPRGVPVVLDFAIAGGNCSAPQGTGCSGNSSCTDAPVGAKGYVCTCLPYYQGNPYIPNGCQDINECSDGTLNDCDDDTTTCVNREGGFDCKCKPGMTRHGTKGPCTERFPLPAKIIVGLSALVVVFVLVFMIYQILKLKKFYEQNGGPILEGVKNIRIYTRKQLKKITHNYKHGIGEGAFGQVYKGTLKSKQPVAIKKSIKVDEDRKKEFTDEVIIQSEMRHKNIVRLLGCCLELDVPMLVYEFVARGSLYDFLFKSRDNVAIEIRLKIAIGSAEGLTYMHSAGESTIRHGDVKSANILLDEEFNPKVSDFGTSSLLARGKAKLTERVIGDMSYIDPIYMEKGIVTQKSDVYSFGIVLIELITRRAATYDEKRSYIANFVQACQDNRQRYFFDNDVTNEDDIKLLEMVSAVAVECLNTDPEQRLDMKQVEHHLRGIIGQSAQHGQQRNYQGSLSPSPDDAALLN